MAHGAAGIKIQPCKTKLFQSNVEYFGHKFSKRGVSMIPEYVQKIKDLPVSKTEKDGICGVQQNLYTPVFSAEEPVEGD